MIKITHTFHCSRCGDQREHTYSYVGGTLAKPVTPAGWHFVSLGSNHNVLLCPKHEVSITVKDKKDKQT